MRDWQRGRCQCYQVSSEHSEYSTLIACTYHETTANCCVALAKPFEPPTADMPLMFRYTTYMGDHHPAEKKVVVEFCTEDIRDLTAAQREKLKKLAGVRYNPETDIVKMSCEMFESQAQNKRYLGDLVDNLLKEAKVRHHNCD